MLEYEVKATRIDAHGSRAQCKDAEIILDTDIAGRVDAFNPAELLPSPAFFSLPAQP
jgi:hypothetical protein